MQKRLRNQKHVAGCFYTTIDPVPVAVREMRDINFLCKIVSRDLIVGVQRNQGLVNSIRQD
jgi:hypothetical protein